MSDARVMVEIRFGHLASLVGLSRVICSYRCAVAKYFVGFLLEKQLTSFLEHRKILA